MLTRIQINKLLLSWYLWIDDRGEKAYTEACDDYTLFAISHESLIMSVIDTEFSEKLQTSF